MAWFAERTSVTGFEKLEATADLDVLAVLVYAEQVASFARQRLGLTAEALTNELVSNLPPSRRAVLKEDRP